MPRDVRANTGQLTVATLRAALAVCVAADGQPREPLVYLCPACGGWHQNPQEPRRAAWTATLTPDCQWWQGQQSPDGGEQARTPRESPRDALEETETGDRGGAGQR